MGLDRVDGVLVAIEYPFVPTRVLYHDQRGAVTWGIVPRNATHVVSAGYSTRPAQALLTVEPPSVLPDIWDRTRWAQWDRVWTHCPAGHERAERIVYPWPIGWPALPDRPISTPLSERRDAVCAVIGNKCSDVAGELYSERARIIDALIALGHDVHVYGSAPWTLGGRYCGRIPLDKKREVMAQYRYALALENTDQEGYFTEKLPDVLAAGCQPIYLGNVPTMCGVPGVPCRRVVDALDLRWLTPWSDALHEEYLSVIDLVAIRNHMSEEHLCKAILSWAS